MTLKKHFYIFIFLLILSCTKNKETLAPTVYKFKVVDEFTNSPITGCSVVLRRYNNPSTLKFDNIGNTDNNGDFTYTFDKTSSHQTQAYEHYFLHFYKENYYDGSFEMAQTHRTINQIVKLKKKTTLVLKMRRITPPINCPNQWYILNFNFSTVSTCVNCFIEPDTASANTYFYHYETVPSNKITQVGWGTHFWSTCTGSTDSPWQKQDVMTGYNDTTCFNIDY